MKILFFSDIHGVPDALEALLRHADRLAPDRLVLLGDALYHGPRNGVPADYDTVRTAELLNANRTRLLAVRGNCDAEVDQLMLEFPIMADFSELWTERDRFFLTHGHLWNENRLPPIAPGTTLAHGHTHLPVLKTLPGGITVFNPGSISLPKGGFPPSFGWYDGERLSLRQLADGAPLQ